jgi:hypothetical protein
MPLRFQPARNASVLISSSSRGPTGAAATIAVGSVSALAAGSTPTVTNTGSSAAATFAFGIPRGADAGIKWLYDSTTSMADPGSGDIRFNHATLSSVTAIAVSNTGSGVDVSDYVATWDDSTNATKGHIMIREEAAGVAAIFRVTAVTDNGDWLQLTVVYVSGSLSLTAADPLYVVPLLIGNAGAMSGPASSTDNAVARWDGAGGTTVQNSGVIIDDSNNVSGIVTLSSSSVELGHASDTTLSRSAAGVLAVEGIDVALNSTGFVHTANTYEVGNATDTTISRASAGVIAVEGINVALNSTGFVHTANTYEVGDAADTTISRASAGVIAVEGVAVALNSTASTHTAGSIELGGTDTTLTRAAAGQLAVEGVKVVTVGKQTICIPASAMVSAATNGAESLTLVTSTNVANIKTLAFDTTTEEYAHFAYDFPKNWDEGVVTYRVSWVSTLGSSNGVTWGLQAYGVGDNENIDTAFGTEVLLQDDVQGTANRKLTTVESTSLTVGNTPAAGDTVFFRIKRKVSDSNDDLETDARLINVSLFYNTDDPTDT